jgi:peptidoglycan/LPS O-acetylase OafA/YrhL
MTTLLAGPTVQFLGAISYSLYLFHATVGWRWVRLFGVWLGPDAPLLIVSTIFVTGCALAVGFAWVTWRWLERPSMRLSKVVPLPTRA